MEKQTEEVINLDSMEFTGEEKVIRSVDVYVNKKKIGVLRHVDDDDPKLNGTGLYEFKYYRPDDLLADPVDYQLSVTGNYPIRKEPYYFMDQLAFEDADRTYSLNKNIASQDKAGEVTIKSTAFNKKVVTTLLPSILFNGIPQGALLKIIMDSPEYAGIDFTANKLALLSITGRNPIGRLRFSQTGTPLSDEKRKSVDATEILDFINADLSDKQTASAGIASLLAYHYHKESGVSGAMPKFMATTHSRSMTDLEVEQHIMRSQYSFDRDAPIDFDDDMGDKNITGSSEVGVIFKTGKKEVPGSVLNEYICMLGLGLAGNHCAEMTINDRANVLVIKRFDLIFNENGMDTDQNYGFEELCAVMGRSVTDKGKGFNVDYSEYKTNSETGDMDVMTGSRSTTSLLDIHRATQQVVTKHNENIALDNLFRSFVFSNFVRNGDAHLRNFGILYNEDMSDVRLAPSYDIFCTDIYTKVASYNFMGVTEQNLNPESFDMGWMSKQDIARLAQQMGLTRSRRKAIIRDAIRGIEAAAARVDVPSGPHVEFYSDPQNVVIMTAMFNVFENSIQTVMEDPDYELRRGDNLVHEYGLYLDTLTELSNDELTDLHEHHFRFLKPQYIPEISQLYLDRELVADLAVDQWQHPLNSKLSEQAGNLIQQQTQLTQDQSEFDMLLEQINAEVSPDMVGITDDDFLDLIEDSHDSKSEFQKTVVDDFKQNSADNAAKHNPLPRFM